jgi:hypothetical protein
MGALFVHLFASISFNSHPFSVILSSVCAHGEYASFLLECFGVVSILRELFAENTKKDGCLTRGTHVVPMTSDRPTAPPVVI